MARVVEIGLDVKYVRKINAITRANVNNGVLLTSDARSEPPYHTAKLSECARVSEGERKIYVILTVASCAK